MTRIVVTGGDGVMGVALREFLPDAYYVGRDVLDVRDARQTHAMLARTEADVVIHAAALTDHQHPDAAEVIRTNILGTRHVAQWCSAYDARMVYLSTHYVYPGTGGHYEEIDSPQPIGAYAWSKLAGEQWVRELCCGKHLIVRGSWYTPEKLDAWRRAAITNAWHSREPVRDAACKIAELVQYDAQGTVNIGGKRRTFADVLENEQSNAYIKAKRQDFANLPYKFPADTSVNTARYDRLISEARYEALYY